MYTIQTIESLKSSGRYAHAGALAAWLGLPSVYGCHYGMRSELSEAMALFKAGYADCLDAMQAG